MDVKALLFAYCPVCRGVTVIMDNYENLYKLGCGETKQDCAFDPPSIKAVELNCNNCGKNTAIAKLPLICDVSGAIRLIEIIANNLNKLRDYLVQLNREYRSPEWKASDGFLKLLRKTALDIDEMEQLLLSIKSYRFSTSNPQTYFKGGSYISAEKFKLWEKIDKLPGGDKDPFDTPVGPTKMCLSSRELASFLKDGEKSEGSANESIQNHLGDCRECLDRLNSYKATRK